MAMNRLVLATCLAACNTAPLAYDDLGRAPGATGQWGTPSDDVCLDPPTDPNTIQVGQYLLCATNNKIVPIDDPIIERCDAADIRPSEPVFYVFDGLEARAYVIAAMADRELVHDEWGGLPILVDW